VSLSLHWQFLSVLKAGSDQERFSGVVLIANDGRPLVRRAYGYSDWFVWKSPDGAVSHFQHGGGGADFTSVLIHRPKDHVYIAVLANLASKGEFTIVS
jgi:hypothetical protein